jgi:hypothetical protein
MAKEDETALDATLDEIILGYELNPLQVREVGEMVAFQDEMEPKE